MAPTLFSECIIDIVQIQKRPTKPAQQSVQQP